MIKSRRLKQFRNHKKVPQNFYMCTLQAMKCSQQMVVSKRRFLIKVLKERGHRRATKLLLTTLASSLMEQFSIHLKVEDSPSKLKLESEELFKVGILQSRP